MNFSSVPCAKLKWQCSVSHKEQFLEDLSSFHVMHSTPLRYQSTRYRFRPVGPFPALSSMRKTRFPVSFHFLRDCLAAMRVQRKRQSVRVTRWVSVNAASRQRNPRRPQAYCRSDTLRSLVFQLAQRSSLLLLLMMMIALTTIKLQNILIVVTSSTSTNVLWTRNYIQRANDVTRARIASGQPMDRGRRVYAACELTRW